MTTTTPDETTIETEDEARARGRVIGTIQNAGSTAVHTAQVVGITIYAKIRQLISRITSSKVWDKLMSVFLGVSVGVGIYSLVTLALGSMLGALPLAGISLAVTYGILAWMNHNFEYHGVPAAA